MRIAIVTDAWKPQVNGVVRTYDQTVNELRLLGHEVALVTPADFRTAPLPTYPSIRVACWPLGKVRKALDAYRPDAVHIATEGTLGHLARRHCVRRRWPFTTAFHTQFPEYIRARVPIPVSWTYRYIRRFHRRAARTLVPTVSQRDRLAGLGFEHLVVWPRGVDTRLFRPSGGQVIDAPRPIFMYMGRVAVEKNIEAFLRLEIEGTKVVVGEGPDRERLAARFPHVIFTGQKVGEELAHHLASADVFVFPSVTDTFGVVLLEAMACGVPVAAFPVTGPVDVVEQGVTGVLHDDLEMAVRGALDLDRQACVRHAQAWSWRAATEVFLGHLQPIER